MNVENKNKEFPCIDQVVDYKGSSWVMRRSKTHNGMPFFFNIDTKESVWNLNESEIERAKMSKTQDKNMENINIENIECPEPKGPPTEYRQDVESQPTARTIFEGQIIGGVPQFAYIPAACGQLLPLGTVAQIPQIAQVGFNVPTHGFNTKVWAINPVQQMLAGSSISPVISQAHTSVSVTYNEPSQAQKCSKPVISRFNEVPSQYENRSRFVPNNRHWSQMKRNNTQRNMSQPYVQRNCMPEVDLRNYLSAKKRRNDFTIPSMEPKVSKEESTSEMQNEQESSVEEIKTNPIPEQNVSYNSDVDVDFLEDRMDDPETYFDAHLLKSLAGPNTNEEHWYIAADRNILLNHLNFLSDLLKSDEKCMLMVPQEEMEELRKATRASCGMPRSTNRGRRAVLFLTKLVKEGQAILGIPTQDSTIKNILGCCSNLTQQNSFVVLLTNDSEIQKIKLLLNIPTFTIKELKHFLKENSKNKDICEPESDNNYDIPDIVTVTITNDLAEPVLDTSNTGEVNNEVPNFLNTEREQSAEENDKEKQQPDLITVDRTAFELISRKKTVDAGVQTENSQDIHTGQPSNMILTPPTNIQSVTVTSTNTPNNTVTSLGESNTRKERRLLRGKPEKTSICSTSNANNNSEKKQYKWRRKRKTCRLYGNDPQNRLIENNEDMMLFENTDSAETSEKTPSVQSKATESSTNKAFNSHFEDFNIDDSEDSSVIIHRRIDDKVIVEETSTSGVISNTTGDSEAESIKPQSFSAEDLKKNILFEVVNDTMEHSLKVRRDEWIARFKQIMEEALTQVLHQDPIFLNKLKNTVAPPWTLQEATHCLKLRFENNVDVIKAADQFLKVLASVTDNRGRFKLDLKPSEFMEMYSYGVYVIDILQSIPSMICEDLQTASDSLEVLHNEIRNPCFDGHNDTLGDSVYLENRTEQNTIWQSPPKENKSTPLKDVSNDNETSQQPDIADEAANEENKSTPLKDVSNDNETSQQPDIADEAANEANEAAQHHKSPRTPVKEASQGHTTPFTPPTIKRGYNLRSSGKKASETKKPSSRQPNKRSQDKAKQENITRSVVASESSFFTSLNLQKNTESLISNESACDKFTPCDVQANVYNTNNENEAVIQPVQNCETEQNTSYEDVRLRNRKYLDMDELDYSEDIDENYDHFDEDFDYSEKDFNGDALDEEEISNMHDDTLGGSTDFPIAKVPEVVEDEKTLLDIKTNNNFSMIFKTLFFEIKEAFSEVHLFCKATHKELIAKQCSASRKREILQKARVAHSNIDHLHKTLNSLVFRETFHPEAKIQTILKQIGLDGISDSLLIEYRDHISKCRDRAKILLDAVDIVTGALM